MKLVPRQEVCLSVQELRTFVQDVLTRSGLAEAHVHAVSETLVQGELDQCGSHGVYRLLTVVRTIRAGRVKLNAVPTLCEPAPALVRVDGDGGFAQLAFQYGRARFVEKTKSLGMAALAVNNCVHFAALWPEIETIAQEGLVAIAMTSNHAWVAPAGGIRPLLGTNPIAFGWPRVGQKPFVFDFATSAVARGDLELHRRSATPLPEGSGLDSEGNPSTDAQAIVTGAMLPFGGHKGSALALMVELMAGPLIGDLTSSQSLYLDNGAGASPLGGELILAIDPQKFSGSSTSAQEQAEIIFGQIIGQGARLPSQRRYAARRENLHKGIVLPAALYKELLAL